MSGANDIKIDNQGVAQFLELAQSANVFLELINNRLIVRAVNPNWAIWKPIRHFLDEIGRDRIEEYFRTVARPHGEIEPQKTNRAFLRIVDSGSQPPR